MKQSFLKTGMGRIWVRVCLTSVAGIAPLASGVDSRENTNNTLPLTVETLVSSVLEHNPELAFYKSEISAARGERLAAGAWGNPEISGRIGDKRAEAPGATGEGLAWSVSVKQTLEWPGRISLRKTIANRQIKLAQLGLDQFRTALAARARTLAYGLFAAQEKAAAAREVAERFQALREVLVQREPAGLTPVLETRIIEATELTLRRQATEAVLEEQKALLELNQLRGEPWQAKLKVSTPALAFPTVPSTEALVAAAQTNNFELLLRQVDLEQQGFKVALARNQRYPAFTVEPYFSRERAADTETQVGIGISVPLPLWNRNTGNIEAEEARRLQATTSMLVTQRNIERQVVEKAQAYETRLKEMANWRPDSVEQFKEAAALADRHYRLGAVPISTYVELQKQYLEAVDALLSTRRQALEDGQDLQRLTGLDFSVGRPLKESEGK
jgi:cobalt-zinc-cadmium efflux system outer membrane protein